MSRPPPPPFTHETAIRKVRLAEEAWNGAEPACVALAHSAGSRRRQLDHRLIKEQRAFREDRIAGRISCGRHTADALWCRCDGSGSGAFDGQRLMHQRIASIRDLAVADAERRHRWPTSRWPDGHAGPTELGL